MSDDKPETGGHSVLTEAESAVGQRRDQIRERLEVARSDLATLRGAIDKTRAAYRDTLARAELTGDPLPSRTELADLQGQLPEAEEPRRGGAVVDWPRSASNSSGPWPRPPAAPSSGSRPHSTVGPERCLLDLGLLPVTFALTLLDRIEHDRNPSARGRVDFPAPRGHRLPPLG